MKDRINRIVTQVRLNLGEIATNEIGHKNTQIYERANYIQAEIMRECMCVETEIKIILLSGQESYDFKVEDISMIKSHETSWGGLLTHKLNSVWNTIPTTGGQYPVFYTIVDKTIKFRAIPLRNDDEVLFWAYQEEPLIGMDDDIEPETPKYADRCLIMGICAEYNPDKFYPIYKKLKDDVGVHAHKKVGVPKESELNW